MTTLTEQTARDIIRKLLHGEDYRIEVVALINAQFLQFAIGFFRKVVDAKLEGGSLSAEADWYKHYFLSEQFSSDDIAAHSGLNKKTIHNMYNSARREIVLSAASEHYDTLRRTIEELADNGDEINLQLKISLNSVSVELSLSESLMVINTLAVKRSALRGGLWSAAGKRVEKPLMQTLCALYGVPNENWDIRAKGSDSAPDFEREIDFFLIAKDSKRHKCEVKLMGRGNPESADAVIARASDVFIADKLSETNKAQLDSLNVGWVQLREANGYQRFRAVLKKFNIPHKKNHTPNLAADLPPIFDKILRD